MRRAAFVLVPMLVGMVVAPAQGGLFRRWRDADCYSLPPPCETAQSCDMVQTWVTETCTVPAVEYRPEVRERVVTRYRRVPETRQVTRRVIVPHYEERSRTVSYTAYRPEVREVEREYTVNVPYREMRNGTRTVCEMVPVEETRQFMRPERRYRTVEYPVTRVEWREESKPYNVRVPYRDTVETTRRVCEWVNVTRTRTVCEDQGSYQEVAYEAPSCGCASCDECPSVSRVCRQWVPNIVRREVEYQVPEMRIRLVPYQQVVTRYRTETRERTVRVPEQVQETATREVPYVEMVPEERTVTVRRPKMREVSFEYPVTLCRQETRTRTEQHTEMVPEERTREVRYRVCVPREETRTFNVTTWRCVPEEHTVSYTVMVPHRVERQYERRVARWVPREEVETR